MKTQFGYYVFKVTEITTASQQTLAQAHDTIRNISARSRSRNAEQVRHGLPKEYQHGDGLRQGLRRSPSCENAPDETATGAASGGAPSRPSARSPQSPRRTPQLPHPAPAPGGPRLARAELAGALLALDEITRRLRRECPWDREQDERSIVPHTVEEAYELADAAHSGDDAKLLDELGDVLFQVYFLSLLLEERGQGDLAAVAEHCRRS